MMSANKDMIVKKVIHKNPWFSVEKHKISENDIYFLIRKKPAVFVIAKTKDNKIVFIREYRYPLDKRILQLPAGMVDSGTHLASAKRELFEETGIKAMKWNKIGEFYVAPGHETTKIIAYLAQNLTETRSLGLEKDILSVEKYSKQEIISLIHSGKIKCGISLAVLLLYFESENNLSR